MLYYFKKEMRRPCHFFIMNFMVQVKVMPLKELLDPQGKAVMSSLGNLGLGKIHEVCFIACLFPRDYDRYIRHRVDEPKYAL